MALIDEIMAAMEAEDITGQAEAGSADVAGTENNNRDIDLNTDNILGDHDTNSGSDNTKDSEESSPDDESGDGNNDDISSSSDLPNNNTDSQNMDDQNTNDSEFEKIHKKRLWMSYKKLYEVVNNSIGLITQYVPNISDAPTIKIMNGMKDNLVQIRDYSYLTMTEDYPSIKYTEMMKRYIGMNHVYDLVIKQLETYFKKYYKDK